MIMPLSGDPPRSRCLSIALVVIVLVLVLAPKVALFSNIGLMVAVLLWRPKGLYPVTNR